MTWFERHVGCVKTQGGNGASTIDKTGDQPRRAGTSMLDRSANLFDDDAPTTDAPTGLTVDPVDEHLAVLKPVESVQAETGGFPRAQLEDPVAIPPAVDRLFDMALVREPRARRHRRPSRPKTTKDPNGVASAKVARPEVGLFRKRIAASALGLRRGGMAAAILALVVVLLFGIAAVLGVGDSPSAVPQRYDVHGAVYRYPDPRSPQIPILRPTEEQRLRARLRALRAQLRSERRRAARLRRAARPPSHRTAVKRPKTPVAATTVPLRSMPRPRPDVLSNRTGAELSVEG